MTYVALLRGINVGGRARIAMADLRRMFEALGHTKVTTYVQSGNVVFRSRLGRGRLVSDLEARIAADLGVPCSVLVRSVKDLDEIVAGNPFLGEARGENVTTKQLHVTFLASKPPAERARELTVPAGETGRFAVEGTTVYLYLPDGYGRTRLGNDLFERRLGVRATTRNWRTVTTLQEMAAGL